LPGRFYLQAIVQLFKENRLANGTFVGLGKRLDLEDVICAVYLLRSPPRAGVRHAAMSRRSEAAESDTSSCAGLTLMTSLKLRKIIL
jgi:poly(3-hydroxyalkanoate) synthetase